MSDDEQGGTGYKILAVLASFLGAMLARKGVAAAWKLVSGNEPPANPEHPDVTWGEAAAWAVISGAVVGLARMVAQKRVASTWHHATGSLPPGMEDAAA
jgi:hypothetical protein